MRAGTVRERRGGGEVRKKGPACFSPPAIRPFRGAWRSQGDPCDPRAAMEVVSLSPLRVGSVLWQPRAGAYALTVVCKATYSLAPGECSLAHEQEPPNEADAHWNDDPARSLHFASDLVPFKARPEVLLTGLAYAPRGTPVPSLVARLIVGEIDKAIEVHCDRAFTQDGKMREGTRFVKMPLAYERAAGGPDTWNPVGVRGDARPDRYGMVPLPNLQPPGRYVSAPGEHVDPVGFGPLAPSWPTRLGRLYHHAATFSARSWNERPLPDIDPAFFNAAPPDQLLEAIRPGERLVLENLSPGEPRLVTNLPATVPRARVERRSGVEEIALRCDTLLIDTEVLTCALVWRGQVMLEHPQESGRVVVVIDGLPESRPAEVRAPEAPRRFDATQTVAEDKAPPAAALPFHAVSAASARAPVPPLPPAQQRTAALPMYNLGKAPPAPTFAAPVPPPATPPPPPLFRAPEPPPVVPPARSAPPTPPPVVVPSVRVAPPAPPARPPLAPPQLGASRSTPTLMEASSTEGERVIELLWHDAACLPALRASPRFRALLDGDHPDDRRDVAAVITRGEAVGADGAVAALADAVGPDGLLGAPLVLLSGELVLTFDEEGDERALLAKRAFQRRVILGAPALRARFQPDGGGEPLPAYLPEALAAELPMLPRLRARLLAEVRLAQEQEAQPIALRAVALARVASLKRR